MSAPATTLTILGCGTLGTAILCGIQDALTSGVPVPADIPSTFVACVQREASSQRIDAALASADTRPPTQILVNANIAGLRAASVVLLGCKPYMVQAILSAAGVSDALDGKLLISICAGVTIAQLRTFAPNTRIVRAMPNTAARIRESMTVIAAQPGLPQHELEMVQWIFGRIGRCLVLDEKHMDVATALCGSGPAFNALVLEAMADGGVLMGVPRAAALEMAAQSMRGTAAMVLEGQHPAIIREQVSTPGGCTISGLAKMEDGNVRSAIMRTIEEATNVAGGLGGKGK